MTTTTTDNANRAPAAPMADTPAATIQHLFDGQHEQALAWRRSDAAERIARLKRLRTLLFARREAIMTACAADFAKPAAEVEVTEILPVVVELNHAIRRLKRWMKPRRQRPTLLLFGTRAEIRSEPRGRCLIISPWNYPINLSFGPLVSAIAAGNTVIVKPSEFTPHCAELMARMIAELFDPTEVAVIHGAVATSEALLALPFDHIFFTGSPAVGRRVMAAAAQNLTSVTLELGGKSPAIVDASADIANAAKTIVWAKFANNGQTCIAPDYVYVHADVHDRFVEAAKAALKTFYGDPSRVAENRDYCRIVNAAHHERLTALLEDAHRRGARLATGNVPDSTARFIAPTLVTDVDNEARLMQEEIFGPLLPILIYHDTGPAIDAINARPKPLALYIYARDEAVIERVLSATSAGGSCINTAMLHFLHARLPFGGVNNSGIGDSHGEAGFRAFSHQRSILRERFSLAFLFRPPYNLLTRTVIRLATRWLG